MSTTAPDTPAPSTELFHRDAEGRTARGDLYLRFRDDGDGLAILGHPSRDRILDVLIHVDEHPADVDIDYQVQVTWGRLLTMCPHHLATVASCTFCQLDLRPDHWLMDYAPADDSAHVADRYGYIPLTIIEF